MSNKPVLKIDWCSHEAAKYAVEKWHYSRSMPAGKLVKVGAWEDDRFIGAVIFGRGANNNIGKPYELQQTEICELVRVALFNHVAFVSQIVAKAIKFLVGQSKGLRLIVSYADPAQGHIDSIYQAMNWVYAGRTSGGTAMVKMANGDVLHKKTVFSRYGTNDASKIGGAWVKPVEKHKYLYPLDKAMRKQIAPLALPYPKKQEAQLVERVEDGD